ncbi:MAG: hypothetical protein WD097_07090 [Balneolales bacterium]
MAKGLPGKGLQSRPMSGEEILSNADIVADETAQRILEMLDSEGKLRTDDGRYIPQPLILKMNAPATVRERMLSLLMDHGIRIADESTHHHSLQIEWEPDNVIVRKRGALSKRTLYSEIVFSWFDTSREMQKTWKVSFEREEEIPAEKVSDIAGTWNPAAFHREKSSRRFSVINRIAEPMLITGAIAVTIYLLYNVRS